MTDSTANAGVANTLNSSERAGKPFWRRASDVQTYFLLAAVIALGWLLSDQELISPKEGRDAIFGNRLKSSDLTIKLSSFSDECMVVSSFSMRRYLSSVLTQKRLQAI